MPRSAFPFRGFESITVAGKDQVRAMKFGLFGINFGVCADAQIALRVAQAAEQRGLESVWTGEHVVLPDPQAPPSPVPPETPFLDPAVALAYVAAGTTTIRLGTGIIILPQRNPLVLAKELASVDVVSRGRLIFGLGIGYLKPEFDALGIPFAHKGARSIEYLDAILAMWTQPQPRYHGRFVNFEGIQAFPRPLQQPHPPIVIGGGTPEAFRRAVEHGNGWYGFALDLDATTRCIAGIHAAARAATRPSRLGELEISITPAGKLDADAVKRFADLGVHRLIVSKRATTEGEMLAAVDKIAELRAG
jgi:probable F420-dependent oxidoreductase